MDRMGIFAVVASKMVLEDAGLAVTEANRERIGCVFGTGIGPMESMEKFMRPLLEEGPAAANPAVFPNTVYNAAGGQVAMNVGIVGAASTVTAGHAAGASSICYGYDLATYNHADEIVSVAVDTLTDTVVDAYREIGLLSPEGAFSLAEAGVALNLERLSAARARGARIYGELLGYSIASDAKGVGRVDPKGRGLEYAMRHAVKRSGLAPGAIVGVWASAVGHTVVDRAEAAAIRRIFDGNVRVLTPKRLFGEPVGAGASLNAVLALLGWQRGDSDRAPRGPVLVNSCSLGGTNFSLVLAPYTE
jgi:3-oxoacyl-[acyl-carrier-protein] synthase II